MENYVPNPWLNISWDNPFADGDRDYHVKLGKQKLLFGSDEYVKVANNIKDPDSYNNDKKNEKKENLTFDSLPEPFWGDINSEVYLLNMNPGEPDSDFTKENDKQGCYLNYWKAMLEHKPMEPGLLFDKENKRIEYDPAKYKAIINDIFINKKNKKCKYREDRLRPHAGDVWQWEMWGQLRDSHNGVNPRVFCIEYFPYHSKSGFTFPSELPSYKYRNKLIQDAMSEEKLIIITRKEKEWFDIEFEGKWSSLEKYPNTIFLRNNQRIWLTTGNIVKGIPPTDDDVSAFEEKWVCKSIESVIKKFYPDSEK